MDIKNKIFQRIEELIVLTLIIMSIFEFLDFLPISLNYIQKIVSLLCLGYLLYHLNLTKIIFGNEKKIINAIIIIIFFLFLMKTIVETNRMIYIEAQEYKIDSIKEEGKYSAPFVFPLLEFIADPLHDGARAIAIENYSFFIAGILLILLSFYLGLKINIEKPSMMDLLHPDEHPSKGLNLIISTGKIFIVLLAFFLLVFNPLMEWLAVSIDSSITVFILIFYFFTLFRKHHKKFSAESLIFKIGDTAENFYSNFITTFHYSSFIAVGICGLLVFHLINDLGMFIMPSILKSGSTSYFENLGGGHNNIWFLLNLDLSHSGSILTTTGIFWSYILNIIFILTILILPVIIWYLFYKKKGIFISRIKMTIFYSSLFMFLISPIYTFSKIIVPNIIGVDISSHTLYGNLLYGPEFTMLASIIIGIFIYSVTGNENIKKIIIIFTLLIASLFFAYYILLYFLSLSTYYLTTIAALFSSLNIINMFIAFYLSLFFLIYSAFYIAGYIFFISETKKEYGMIK